MSRLACCLIVIAVLATAGGAVAGEDVVLRDAAGKALKPSQTDQVSITKTCGDCHDVAEKAKTVHFNRKSSDVTPESGDCLACHLGAGKSAFTPQGAIRKTPRLSGDAACLSCHPNVHSEMKARRGAHKGMACYDCHKEAGHVSKRVPSCLRCHNGSTSAPEPTHFGIPALHMEVLACETCHIARIPGGGRPGHEIVKGKVTPVDADGSPVHHGVAKASAALGRKTCSDCHSENSRFFLGKTCTGQTTPSGKPICEPTYRALDHTRTSVFISGVRERLLKPVAGWIFVGVLVLSIAHYFIFGPHRTSTRPGEPEIQRFTAGERLVHLLALASFVLLGLTGLAFLLHVESPGSHLRTMHGWIGPLFVIGVVGMLITWWKNAVFTSCDKEWLYKLGGYLWIRGECPAEKFNAGQKLFYWFVVILGGLGISFTGIMLLIGGGRAAAWVYTAHDIAAVLLIGGIIAHAYLSILANPGTVRSMLTGRVPRSWAEHHHPNWLDRIDRGSDS